jgi:hypothetical protein
MKSQRERERERLIILILPMATLLQRPLIKITFLI